MHPLSVAVKVACMRALIGGEHTASREIERRIHTQSAHIFMSEEVSDLCWVGVKQQKGKISTEKANKKREEKNVSRGGTLVCVHVYRGANMNRMHSIEAPSLSSAIIELPEMLQSFLLHNTTLF